MPNPLQRTQTMGHQAKNGAPGLKSMLASDTVCSIIIMSGARRRHGEACADEAFEWRA